MDNSTVAKKVTSQVVGLCVSGVVVTLVHNNTPTFNKTQKVKLYIGAYVLGAMAADRARKWTDKQIEEIIELYNALFVTTEEPIEQ